MISRKEEAEFEDSAGQYRAEQARRERMAVEGDVDGIWEIITRPRPVAFDAGEIFPLLLRAIEVRSRQSPALFSSEILARVVALTSYLTLRSHWLLAARIEEHDRSRQGRGRVELPPAFTEKVIPQLLALQESLGQVLMTQASVARGWALARAKRLENDKAEVKPRAKATSKDEAKAGRKPVSAPVHANDTHSGNGKPGVNGKHRGNGEPGVNRIAGLLDGFGSKANGFHGDE